MRTQHWWTQPIVSWMIVVILGMSGGGGARAEEPVYELGTFYIPEFVEDAQHGKFIEILHEIEKRTGQHVTVTVRPTKRTLQYFYDRRILGVFPGVDPFFETDVAKSGVFHLKREMIFHRTTDAFTAIPDLEGKTVGLTAGYSYTDELLSNPRITFEYTQTDEQNMKKLSAGRVDAVICEETSGVRAVQVSGVTNVTYDPTASISTQHSYFAFQPTEIGYRLADEFSAALQDMKEDGTLQQILGVSDEWMNDFPEP